jgi:hypothetical protein
MSNLTNIFQHSHCLSKEQLLGYFGQKLDIDEVYLVESHLNDCQFCSDAIDGLIESELLQTQINLNELKKDFDQQLIQYKNENTPRIALKKENELKLTQSKSNRWLAVASILLLVGLGGYSVFSYMRSQNHELALTQKKENSSKQDVDYKLPTNPSANEIVHIEVLPTDLTNNESASTDGNGINDKKIKEVKTEPILNKSIATKTNSQQEEKIITNEPAKPKIAEPTVVRKPMLKKDEKEYSQNESSYDNISANNYNESKKADEVKQEIVAVAPTGKYKKSLSNSNVPSTQQNNQLSYPSQTNGTSNTYNINETLSTDDGYSNKKQTNNSYEDGLQLYNKGNFKKSIKAFEKALKTATNESREDIQFHLAQAYLKDGSESKATQLFELLANGTKYKIDAKVQLEKLKVNSKK